MNNKFFTFRAQADGLWLEIKGSDRTALVNLTGDKGSLEYKCACEVWAQLRASSCSRCGEEIEGRGSADGCRDPQCPVPMLGES